MCNAYEVGKGRWRSAQHHNTLKLRELEDSGPTQLIRRTDPAPVLTDDGKFHTMRWGFSRPGLGTVNNTRDDKLDRPLWSEAFRNRRCLIPATAFYEWSGPKGRKRTHRFTHPAGCWLWIAGIWEDHNERGRCFSMLTTAANAIVRQVHERMPVVLADDEFAPYMAGGMTTFAPEPTLLQMEDAPNPLKKRPEQGELF